MRWRNDQTTRRPDDQTTRRPTGRHSRKATITIKKSNDNRYYYWQWREGNKIKSKYKGPVNSDE